MSGTASTGSTARQRRVDVLVVGAGIAGLSVGAELAADRRVAVLEAEAAPATQATGRSAAVFIDGYGGSAITPFTAASRAWFATGGGFADHALLTPRGMLVVAAPGDDAALGAGAGWLAGAGEPVSVGEAVALFPALRPERVALARHDPRVGDLDVAGAVDAFRRAFLARGGLLACDTRFVRASRGAGGSTAPGSGGPWRVATSAGEWEAEVIVDAAGAWADGVAAACGIEPVGLRPLRRTACTFRPPADVDPRGWPLVADAGDRWYVKPEPGLFLASPADESPAPPGDCRPEEADVARALDAVREATTLPARSITAAWAGLRTFAPDRGLVLGRRPRRAGVRVVRRAGRFRHPDRPRRGPGRRRAGPHRPPAGRGGVHRPDRGRRLPRPPPGVDATPGAGHDRAVMYLVIVRRSARPGAPASRSRPSRAGTSTPPSWTPWSTGGSSCWAARWPTSSGWRWRSRRRPSSSSAPPGPTTRGTRPTS